MLLTRANQSSVGLLILGLCAFLVACQPNLDITFENRTSEDVSADVNGQGYEKVEAGDSETFSILTDKGGNSFEITVKTQHGLVVYHRKLTKKQLEAMGRKIVLDEPLQQQPATPDS